MKKRNQLLSLSYDFRTVSEGAKYFLKRTSIEHQQHYLNYTIHKRINIKANNTPFFTITKTSGARYWKPYHKLDIDYYGQASKRRTEGLDDYYKSVRLNKWSVWRYARMNEHNAVLHNQLYAIVMKTVGNKNLRTKMINKLFGITE
jgi:hypothetical protein